MLSIMALSGCAARTIPPAVIQERIVEVSVPVTVSCLSGDRPTAVKALKEQYGLIAWSDMTIRQKSALVVAKGLERQSFGERATAATAGCR
jgi:hypothetical protein